MTINTIVLCLLLMDPQWRMKFATTWTYYVSEVILEKGVSGMGPLTFITDQRFNKREKEFSTLFMYYKL